ncbi:hypothetical protein [Latilactobacillus curvatus]|uniref:hypothetical protein n=1 Tax=Latilactobacillus curvatus TaxID=28038 RepID=UPI0009786D64|nr:hypothetical protein [Latilactobacillus curvatus]MCT3524539.1 hypothetical protein [Latilactobacillus curvatus]MCW8780527.1 hypothetical protein [Latilactobacillus curvatus]UTB70983.1 hypothetical protein A4W71_07835 [Latilactobacillus curvatus]UTB73735.1 hypothetical protein A4W73_02275 [Latilactobacillus curvatus]UTY79640.1 hypothetical protein A4W76_02290 [Latilactobacillus curvatus]
MNKKYSVDEALTEMLTFKNGVIIIVTAICFAVLGLLLRGQGMTATSYNAVSRLQVTQYNADERVMTFNSSDPVFLNTYLENLKSTPTQKAVKRELAKKKIKLSIGEIDSMVTFEAIPQTTLVKLKVSGDTKKEVTSVSHAYDKVAIKQYKKDMKTGSVKLVDYNQSKSTTTTRMSVKKIVFFMSVLGLFLSAGLIFVRKYFNQKIVSRNFIESRTATTVINDANISDVQNIAADLVAHVQNNYQVVGTVITDNQQVTLLNQVINQLKEWQFDVKLVAAKDAFTKETTMIPENEDQLIFVMGYVQNPQERLALTKVDGIFTVVQPRITMKNQLLAVIKFTKDATIPFIGSLYLK